MSGRHLEPDHSRGDANSIGGYALVHGRPAAFEGADGYSYSVSVEADETNDVEQPFGAFFLFVRWKRMGDQGVEGHLESEFLAFGDTRRAAVAQLNMWQLNDVKRALDACIHRDTNPIAERRWWDVMAADSGDESSDAR